MYGPILEVLLKTAMLLSVVLLIGVALGRVSSSRRHFLYGAAVVGALALAPITLAAPRWLTLEVPLNQPEFRRLETASEPSVRWWGGVGAPESGESIPGVPLPPSNAEPTPVASRNAETSSAPIFTRLIAAGYLLGVASLLFALGRSLLLLQGLARDGASVPDEDWRRQVLYGLRNEAGRPDVGLVESARCSIPFVWGWRSPVILLPTDSRAWSAVRLKSVLIHELAHVRQKDVLFRFAAEMLCAVQWVNPLTWMVAGRLRANGEAASDDAVLAAGVQPTDYAGELLGLGIERRWHLRLAGAMGGGSPLGRRIEAVLDGRLARSAITRKQRWGVTVCLAISFAVLVSADWQERQPAPLAPATGSTGLESRPATAAVGDATVPVHLRWASGPESGAAFLGGSVALDDDARVEVHEPGFFLLFHRADDGSIRSAHAVTGLDGAVHRALLSVVGISPWNDDPTWIADDLPLVGRKLRDLGERVSWRGSPLSTYADDPSALRVSGSVMTGLPAITESGSQGSLVASWRSGADRIGLLACGAPGAGMDADGARSLVRRVMDRRGEVSGLSEGECLVAFVWNQDRAELRLLESYRAFGGSERIYFSDGSQRLPNTTTQEWLLALLSSSATQVSLER